MKPTKTLILGLREAAQRLRQHPEQYNWYSGVDCNCGILAQCLLHCDRTAIDIDTAWSTAVAEARVCQQTGLPVKAIFAELGRHGLSLEDFKLIEFPPNPNYLQNPCGYRNPTFVAAYFDRLADDLERQRKAQFASHD